jgi:L-lactate dehydrogenase complex protein LldG
VVGLAVSPREEILARVRRGLADVPAGEAPADVAVAREYREREPDGAFERFLERVADYGAGVRVCAPAELAEAVGEACAVHGIARAVVPPDLPASWLPPGFEAVPDETLDVRELDRIGAAITGCALAIAETGTLVLDAGPRQGRRALTLVPDFHLCVVEEAQVVDGVPAAMRLLAENLPGERRPVTVVSGPSATTDLELSRGEGVHGPRTLELVVVRA